MKTIAIILIIIGIIAFSTAYIADIINEAISKISKKNS